MIQELMMWHCAVTLDNKRKQKTDTEAKDWLPSMFQDCGEDQLILDFFNAGASRAGSSFSAIESISPHWVAE